MSESNRRMFLTRKRVLILIGMVGAYYIVSSFWPTWFGRAALQEDEEVTWFPTVGHLGEDGSEWIIPVHGWVFEAQEDDTARNAAIAAVRKSIGVDDAEEIGHLERRVRAFLVDSQRGKELEIKIGGRSFALRPTGANGHVRGEISVPADVAKSASSISFETILRKGDVRKFPGIAHLLPAEGLSVISDIDDTIKISEVTDKRKLMRKTFLEPFAAVPAMPELYQKIAEDHGARFHFVSGSPWQLYRELATFTEEAGFPPASFHLRLARFKDPSAFSLVSDPVEFKVGLIVPLLEQFPLRKFVLIGDSGEKDPEVYGEIARRFPEQVARIFIRNVTGEEGKSERFRDAMRGVPDDIWEVFHEPAGLNLSAEASSTMRSAIAE